MIKEYKTIVLDEVDSVAILRLNRPEKLNAFNMQMFEDMLDAIDFVNKNDEISSLVLTGSGRAFCAGADLSMGDKTFDKNFDTRSDFESDYRRDAGGILTLKIYNSLKPVIAACNGDAVGVGATMQLAADIRIAVKKSRFGFVFAKRGIVPDGCASWFLPKIVGISKAYTTRVGEGPFLTELFDDNAEMLAKRGHEFGATTGRPRRCGWLDLVALKKAIFINSVDSLCMTKADVLDAFENISVCVAYDDNNLPIYKRFEGWQEDTSQCSSYDELPQKLKDYVKFIEETVECKVSIISVGPSREQSIHL